MRSLILAIQPMKRINSAIANTHASGTSADNQAAGLRRIACQIAGFNPAIGRPDVNKAPCRANSIAGADHTKSDQRTAAKPRHQATPAS